MIGIRIYVYIYIYIFSDSWINFLIPLGSPHAAFFVKILSKFELLGAIISRAEGSNLPHYSSTRSIDVL